MLRFVSDPLDPSVPAALYREGDDVIIIINSVFDDAQARCEVVNRLLARLAVPTTASA